MYNNSSRLCLLSSSLTVYSCARCLCNCVPVEVHIFRFLALFSQSVHVHIVCFFFCLSIHRVVTGGTVWSRRSWSLCQWASLYRRVLQWVSQHYNDLYSLVTSSVTLTLTNSYTITISSSRASMYVNSKIAISYKKNVDHFIIFTSTGITCAPGPNLIMNTGRFLKHLEQLLTSPMGSTWAHLLMVGMLRFLS